MNRLHAKSETLPEKKRRAKRILTLLEKKYKPMCTHLVHKNPFQLLVVTILSAQCTDERVNKVAPALFKKFSSPPDFASADLRELKKLIHSTGFYNNKAKNIKAMSKIIEKEFSGKVPKKMEELITLPGVARKTANIVLTCGFGITEGIAVDTHVKRLSNRFYFSRQKNPDKIEQDLMLIFDKKHWNSVNSAFILHGRRICGARRPSCSMCIASKYCPSSLI